MSRQELLTDRAPICRFPEPCVPPVWARSGHAQTLFGHLLPSRGEHRWRRDSGPHREVSLPDSDRLLVFEVPGASGVRIHLFHGLGGDVNSESMRRTAAVLAARGHEIWSVNHRNCGEGRGLARRPFHSGRTEDLQATLAESRADAPDRIHLLIGFSLSGSLALLHAAEQRLPRPDGIIAVNPPLDLDRASLDIGSGFSRLYERSFVRRLRPAVTDWIRATPEAEEIRVPRGASLRHFDELFTAPVSGFKDRDDYYSRCSTAGRLHQVETPTVILTAEDDPFVDASLHHHARRSPAVFTHIEPVGGHLGYLSRRGLGVRRWLDEALSHYVDELIRTVAAAGSDSDRSSASAAG